MQFTPNRDELVILPMGGNDGLPQALLSLSNALLRCRALTKSTDIKGIRRIVRYQYSMTVFELLATSTWATLIAANFHSISPFQVRWTQPASVNTPHASRKAEAVAQNL
jgi:hypothetical protein